MTIILLCTWILSYSSSTLEQLQHIEWVLSKLRSSFFFFAKPTNYESGLTKLEYLEYIILSGTVKYHPKKSGAILYWPFPTNAKEL